MRLPRLTTRRLMVVVAVVAVVMGTLVERRHRFKNLAAYHQAEIMRWFKRLPMFAGSSDPVINGHMDWHESMRLKYKYAADHPWLPVPRDRPEPK